MLICGSRFIMRRLWQRKILSGVLIDPRWDGVGLNYSVSVVYVTFERSDTDQIIPKLMKKPGIIDGT